MFQNQRFHSATVKSCKYLAIGQTFPPDLKVIPVIVKFIG